MAGWVRGEVMHSGFGTAALTGLSASLAGPALATFCHFDRECLDDQTCRDADIEVQILLGDQGPDDVRMRTPWGEFPASWPIGSDPFAAVIAEDDQALFALSIDVTTMKARFAAHRLGPELTTYAGTCRMEN
ncbi:MAG: hypothetical protein AB3N23_02475 [Paracoccaceae bacterium]